MWVGIVLVAVSVVAGSRVLAASDDTVGVWAVTSDLGAGDTVSADDLVARRVRFADPGGLDSYFAVGDDVPTDLAVLRGVGAGELLPRTAVGPAGGDGLVQLPVAVEAELVPPAVGAGSVVDVYLLSSGGGRCRAGCAPVLEAVTVVAAPSVDEGFGASGRRQLVLGVSDDEAKAFFAAYGNVESPVLSVVRRG